MDHRLLDSTQHVAIARLFTTVFTSSEGADEGRLIGDLASELSLDIDNRDIVAMGTFEGESLVASIFFTRLQFNAPVRVYMLAPVAVSTPHQGKGIGQSLINFGLNALKSRSVDVVVTYGDPAFYSQVGFQFLPEDVIRAPLKLSMPGGWLGQSLTADPIPVVSERPVCVKAFNNPVYW